MKQIASVCVLCLLSLGLFAFAQDNEAKKSEIDTLNNRITNLEIKVNQLESMAKVWNEGLTTEYAPSDGEQTILDELR